MKKNAATARKRIVVVDDHAIIRHGLASLLADEEDLEICAEARYSHQIIEILRAL